MDHQLFRKKTDPNLYPHLNQTDVAMIVQHVEVPLKATTPIENPRYSGYASIMSDGRLITDYRSHCALNYENPAYGNSVRQWLQHNADAIMQVTRKRQADSTGASFMKTTIPSEAVIQKCDEYQCQRYINKNRTAIGLGRSEPVPELFGTFGENLKQAPYPSGIKLTQVFEGGRNTPRGRTFTPMSDKPIHTKDTYGISG